MVHSKKNKPRLIKPADLRQISKLEIPFKALIKDLKNPSLYTERELRAIAIKAITILSHEEQENMANYCRTLAEGSDDEEAIEGLITNHYSIWGRLSSYCSKNSLLLIFTTLASTILILVLLHFRNKGL